MSFGVPTQQVAAVLGGWCSVCALVSEQELLHQKMAMAFKCASRHTNTQTEGTDRNSK